MSDTRLHEQIRSVLKDVRRFAYSLARSVADADDLLQMTVVRLLEKGIPDDSDARKWSFRVCKNLWIDTLRAKQTRQRWDQATSQDDLMTDGVRHANARLELGEVHAAILGLPEEQRAVLSLVAVEGLSYREASEILSIPIGTVMSRLARARAAIDQEINPAPMPRETGEARH